MNIANLPAQDPSSGGYLLDPRRPIVSAELNFPEPRQIPSHRHPRGQLIYASEGVVRVMSEKGSWVVPAHQAVWVPPNTEHAINSAGPVTLGTLYVDPTSVRGLPETCCVTDVSPLLRELILEAVRIGNGYGANDAPVQRLMAVLLDRLRELRPSPLFLPMAQDRRLQTVLDALMKDPADRRDLGAWAELAGSSQRTLARLFLRDTGMTFAEWRKQLRLLEAIDRLGSGESVTRVALELGYDSPSAFITMFRRTLGAPPTRYLQQGAATN